MPSVQNRAGCSVATAQPVIFRLAPCCAVLSELLWHL